MSTHQATSRGTQLLSINIFFCIVAGVTFLARCYTRALLVKAFGPDDWIMVVATIFFIAYCISSNRGVRHGTGQHMKDLAKKDISLAMEYWWFCYLFFSLTMVACKSSFAWFLLRITTQRLHSLILYCASLCTILAGLAFFLVTLFQCQPISFYWNKEQEGACLPMNVVMVLAYVYSVFSVLTDFTFAILPAFVIWNLQLERKSRVAVVFLVWMGCFASTAVVVRCVYLPDFVEPDFLWATTDIAIWSTVEMGLFITTTSLGTLRPLIKHLRRKTGSFTPGTVSTRTNQCHGCRGWAAGAGQKSVNGEKASDEAIHVPSETVLADRVSGMKVGGPAPCLCRGHGVYVGG